MLHRLIVSLLVLVSLAHPLGAAVRNTEFVEPLVCSLTKVLAVPVRARTLQFALTPDLRETNTQFSPQKIAGPFLRATEGNSDHARPYRYFILEEDLGSKPLNYVFAETYGGPGPYNLSVMSFPRSLHELDLKSAEYCPEDRAALVAARVLREKPSESCSTVVAGR